jgi:hypothetical protein
MVPAREDELFIEVIDFLVTLYMACAVRSVRELRREGAPKLSAMSTS